MLTFCFHQYGPGGVQSLIINIVRELNTINQKINLLDYQDGYIKKQLENQHIKFEYINLNFSPVEIVSKISSNDVFVLFFSSNFERLISGK